MPTIIDGTNGVDKIAAGAIEKADLPTGSVLQVVSTTKVDAFSSTSAGWLDVTGLTATITPTSTSSKILIFADVSMGMSDMNNLNYVFRFLRGSTVIGASTVDSTNNGAGGVNMYLSAGSIPFVFGNFKAYLDSPASTSSLTYKIQVNKIDPSGTIYVNRRGVSTDPGGTSGITLMEIAG